DIFTNSLKSKLLLEELDNNIVQSTIYNGIILGKPNQRKIDIKLRETESVDVAVNKILEDQNILDNIQEAIEASLVYLENDRVLFVPRESKIRIFLPDQKKDFIKQVDFKDIEEDDFIVIRNERDTKLIAEVADQILQSKANRYRMLQNEWKDRLRSM